MTNLEWLHQMENEDERYYKQETTIRKYENEHRITKALEIIAEELINVNNSLMNIIVNGIKQQTYHP